MSALDFTPLLAQDQDQKMTNMVECGDSTVCTPQFIPLRLFVLSFILKRFWRRKQ